MSSSSEDFRLELQYLRDNLVDAAASSKTAVLTEGLETYEAIVKVFVDVLAGFSGKYNKSAAWSEMHSIGGGWSEIDWIRDDFREIADAALASGNLNVLLPSSNLPIRLAQLAYSERDYFIFAQFLEWVPFFYVKSLETEGDTELGALIRERLSGYVRDTGRYYILPELEESSDKDRSTVAEFAAGLEDVFSQLLKAALDNGRFDDFTTFEDSLYGTTAAADEEYGLHGWGQQLSDPEGSPIARHFGNCDSDDGSFFLGLTPGSCEIRPRLGDKSALEWHTAIRLPSELGQLWDLYLHAREERFEDQLAVLAGVARAWRRNVRGYRLQTAHPPADLDSHASQRRRPDL